MALSTAPHAPAEMLLSPGEVPASGIDLPETVGNVPSGADLPEEVVAVPSNEETEPFA